MDCSLAALIACFSWSNLFVDTSVVFQDNGIERIFIGDSYVWNDGYQLADHAVARYQFAENPYGKLAVGYQVQINGMTWTLEAAHSSSLTSGKDRGINSLALGVRWFPFSRRRH